MSNLRSILTKSPSTLVVGWIVTDCTHGSGDAGTEYNIDKAEEFRVKWGVESGQIDSYHPHD